jgi:hypothetical protein
MSFRTPHGRANAPLMVASALTLALGVGTAQAQSYEMVIAHLLPEDLTVDEIAPAMARFESLVEAWSGGAPAVQVFGAS